MTGSVAEMRAPKCRLSMKVTLTRLGVIWVTPYMTPPTVKVLITVPRKAKAKMEPMLRKKYFFFMEYPAWKMIGGSRMLKKISGSKVVFSSISLSLASLTSPLKLWINIKYKTLWVA